ncbi:uncharacterized protein LOC144440070 [Glandiceps talaboti]
MATKAKKEEEFLEWIGKYDLITAETKQCLIDNECNYLEILSDFTSEDLIPFDISYGQRKVLEKAITELQGRRSVSTPDRAEPHQLHQRKKGKNGTTIPKLDTSDAHVSPGAIFLFESWNKEQCRLPGFHRRLIQHFCERHPEVVNVYSTVIGVHVSEEQMKDAKDTGVTLLLAKKSEFYEYPEDSPKLQWLKYHQTYYPHLSDLHNIKHVVGYNPKTAAAAADLRKNIYPEAELTLINHEHPAQECLSAPTDIAELDKFEDAMLKMSSVAHKLFSIGPSIYHYFDNAYRAEYDGKKLSSIPHKLILPEPGKGFCTENVATNKNTHKKVIFTYGNFDNQRAVESLDEIAAAIGRVGDMMKDIYKPVPDWVIAGVPKRNRLRVLKYLRTNLKCSHIEVKLNPPCNAGKLLRYLRQSHLCIVAPCYKDYSFDGLEAVALGVPIATKQESHVGELITQYFKKFKQDCILGYLGSKWSATIYEKLDDTELSFTQAKELREEFLKCKDIADTYDKFAADLTTKITSSPAPNGLPVDVHLESIKKSSGNKAEQDDELQGTFDKCEGLLNRKSSDVANDQDSCDRVKRSCQDNSGEGTSVSDIGEGSLGLTLHFPYISNLYRFEANCNSGIFAKSLESLLITDEMRQEAAKVKMPLKLEASYDMEKFKEIEDFFTQRDGRPKKDMTECIDDTIEEESDEELLPIEEYEVIFLEMEQQFDKSTFPKKYLPMIFDSKECRRHKGIQSDILRVVVQMTERNRHILHSKQEILALLGVRKYLVTDVKKMDLTGTELEDLIAREAEEVVPVAVKKTPSQHLHSLLPEHPSDLSHSIGHIINMSQDERQSLESKNKKLLLDKLIIQGQLSAAKQEVSLLSIKQQQLLAEKEIAEQAAVKLKLQADKVKSADATPKLVDLENQLKQKQQVVGDLQAKLSEVEHFIFIEHPKGLSYEAIQDLEERMQPSIPSMHMTSEKELHTDQSQQTPIDSQSMDPKDVLKQSLQTPTDSESMDPKDVLKQSRHLPIDSQSMGPKEVLKQRSGKSSQGEETVPRKRIKREIVKDEHLERTIEMVPQDETQVQEERYKINRQKLISDIKPDGDSTMVKIEQGIHSNQSLQPPIDSQTIDPMDVFRHTSQISTMSQYTQGLSTAVTSTPQPSFLSSDEDKFERTTPYPGGFKGQQPSGGIQGQQPLGGIQGQQPSGGIQGHQPSGGFQGQQPSGGFQGQQPSGGFQGQLSGGFQGQQPPGGFQEQASGGFQGQQLTSTSSGGFHGQQPLSRPLVTLEQLAMSPNQPILTFPSVGGYPRQPQLSADFTYPTERHTSPPDMYQEGPNIPTFGPIPKGVGQYKFNKSGQTKPGIPVKVTITTMGEYGSQPANYKYPCGIIVNADNDLVICDSDNHRLQIVSWDNQCKYIITLDFIPRDVAVSSDSNLYYITGLDINEVRVYNKKSQLINSFGKQQHIDAYGIFLTSEGFVYITDTNRRCVRKYGVNGNHIKSSTSLAQNSWLWSLVVNTKNEVFVTDRYNKCVYVLNKQLTIIYTFGKQQLQGPYGICLHPHCDVIYVSDWCGNRVAEFKCNGEFIRYIAMNQLSKPYYIAVSQDKPYTIAVTQPRTNCIKLLHM